MFELNANINTLFKIFKKAKKELYLVGGCVRDSLLGKIPHDYDFATNATPTEMRLIASKNGIELLPTGELYGTMTFKFDRELYEVTTYRADGTYGDGRRPDNITFSTRIEDDLSRRDFTVNAIAWSPKTGLVDLFDGQKDLQDKKIRTVGNPDDRFTEDALRMLRALRFRAKLNFSLDTETYASISRNVKLIKNVSKERIGAELLQIFKYSEYTDELIDKVANYSLNFDFEQSYPDLINEYKYMGNYNVTSVLSKLYKYTHNYWNSSTRIDKAKEIEFKKYGFGDCIKKLFNLFRCFNYLRFTTFTYPSQIKKVLDILQDNEERIAILELNILDSNQKFVLMKSIINKDPITIKDLNISSEDLMQLGFKDKKISEAYTILQEYIFEHPDKNNLADLKTALISYYI